jgi:hypothetical protein
MPQMYGVHATVVGVGQLPCPSQTVGFVCVPAAQLSGVPQAVLLSGKTKAPASKVQPMAPQVGSLVEQTDAQQLPAPASPKRPQMPDLHASSSVQAPVLIGEPQTPWLQMKPVAQSLLEAQLELHPPSLSQPRLFGQAVGLPTWQLPLPSQLLAVAIAMLQEPPQETLG